MKKIIISFAILLAISLSLTQAEERFGGLGLVVAQLYDQSTQSKAGELIVINVLPGTDAQKQGIQRGDVITEIDNKATNGVDFSQLVTKSLRGAVGSVAALKIRRPGTEDLTIRVTRAELSYPSK